MGKFRCTVGDECVCAGEGVNILNIPVHRTEIHMQTHK